MPLMDAMASEASEHSRLPPGTPTCPTAALPTAIPGIPDCRALRALVARTLRARPVPAGVPAAGTNWRQAHSPAPGTARPGPEQYGRPGLEQRAAAAALLSFSICVPSSTRMGLIRLGWATGESCNLMAASCVSSVTFEDQSDAGALQAQEQLQLQSVAFSTAAPTRTVWLGGGGAVRRAGAAYRGIRLTLGRFSCQPCGQPSSGANLTASSSPLLSILLAGSVPLSVHARSDSVPPTLAWLPRAVPAGRPCGPSISGPSSDDGMVQTPHRCRKFINFTDVSNAQSESLDPDAPFKL
jgi:hypothetical protein